MAIDFGPAQRRAARAHGRTAMRPIGGTILEERAKAYRIRTVWRTAWLPKRLVTHDAEKGVFMVPNWLCEQKLLD